MAVAIGGYRWMMMAGLLVASAVMATARSAFAQTEPTAPVGEPPCIGMPAMKELALDDSLSLATRVAVAVRGETYARDDGASATSDVAVLSWGVPAAKPACIWIAEVTPGDSSVQVNARFILPGNATSLKYVPSGAPGGYCLQIVPLAKNARGDAQNVCFTSSNPRRADLALADTPSTPMGAPDSHTTELLTGAAAGAILVLTSGGAVAAVRRKSRRPAEPLHS